MGGAISFITRRKKINQVAVEGETPASPPPVSGENVNIRRRSNEPPVPRRTNSGGNYGGIVQRNSVDSTVRDLLCPLQNNHIRQQQQQEYNREEMLFNSISQSYGGGGQHNTLGSINNQNNPNTDTDYMMAYTTMSLGMNQEDLLFNMMYFGGIESVSRGDQFGMVLNSVMEETIAAHSESNTPYKLRPASIKAISNLKHEVLTNLDEIEEKDCAVCKEPFEVGNTICILTKCNHGFHEDCILHWLKLQNFCPVCRSTLGVIAEGDEELMQLMNKFPTVHLDEDIESRDGEDKEQDEGNGHLHGDQNGEIDHYRDDAYDEGHREELRLLPSPSSSTVLPSVTPYFQPEQFADSVLVEAVQTTSAMR